MTPRIPRGWTRATERGSGVWVDYVDGRWRAALGGGALLPERTYIRRTDPSVSTDPNHALRLEDEAARLVSDRPDDAEPMVPGMMRLSGGQMVPLAGLTWGRVGDGSGMWVALAEWEHEVTPLHDSRTPAEFAAAYTAAWEYTERRRAEIAEDVRRADEPPAPDLGEWPGRADVPPNTIRDVEIMTPHGACLAWYSSNDEWRAYATTRDCDPLIATRDVLRWRDLPCAVVEGGRVTGVTRG